MTDRDALIAELRWCLDEGSQGPRSAKALAAALDALAAPPPAPPADLVAIVRDLQEADAVLKQVASARAMRRWHEALNKVVAYAPPAAPRVPDTPQGWKSVIDLVSDDAWAMTFQSLGQYRTALLKALRAGQATQEPQSVQPRGECPTCGGVWPCGRCTTSAVDLDALKARLKADAAPPQEPPR